MNNWNGVRFTDDASDHVESYFIKAVSPDSDRALWLKATIFCSAEAPSEATAEGWAIAFDRRPGRENVAVKHSLSFRDAWFARDALDIRWTQPDSDDRLELSQSHTSGSIHTGSARISWELSLEGDDKPFIPLPALRMYKMKFPSSKTVTPWPDLRISGKVVVGDDAWELAGWHGMQGHNWGRGHAEQYAWAHCNQWNEPEQLVLEAVTARVRTGRVLTPPLTTICVRYGGHDWSFNGPLQVLGTRTEMGLRRYGFAASTRKAKIDAVIDANAESFVGLHYLNPNGRMTYCLNAKLASARVRFEPRGEHPVALSSRASALEIGTLQSDHGVEMVL